MAQLVEDGGEAARRHLTQFLAALLREADGHLDQVVGCVLQQQQFVRDLLVDEMGDELGGAEADLLVVAPVAAPELQDETRQKLMMTTRAA